MFTLSSIVTPRDQKELFKNFDPLVGTWLVSDLKSKLDLNRQLLSERAFIPGDAVLRASELWKTLLSRLRPDLQIISREFALVLIGQKLAKSELDWVQAPGAPTAVSNYMTQLMPILAHPNGEEMMREWLEANAPSAARWGRWFDLSLTLWREFLEEGFIAPQWASGVLVNEPSLTEVWSRPLFVDLGAELDQVEADLLVQLSQVLDVNVLVPEPAWVKEFPNTLTAYKIFEEKLKVQRVAPVKRDVSETKKSYRKYTTMIAEVKAAVAQTRQWLDEEKVPASRIALVAPDIELYWPALSSYLEQEGIPCQKDQVRRLHSYPDIARFLANLRLRTGTYDETDVELAVFEVEKKTDRLITYEKFKTLYSTLYAREDLDRDENIKSRFALNLSPFEEVGRDDFVSWSLQQLPGEAELKRVEALFKKFFAEIPQSMRFTVQRWMTYLEQLASKVECRLKEGEADGVAVLNLTSADNSPAEKMMVIGLTESALRKSGGTSVLYSDVWSLGQQFGFHLPNEDQARLEFEARWITENSERELILCVPETDFGGGAQAPSWLWVMGSRRAEQGKELSIPELTRWDEMQKSEFRDIAQARNWSEVQRRLIENGLREDLGEIPHAPFGENLVETLSASGIEDYLNCPFIFAAKRLFGLSDVPELDLEVDPSQRGSLMHKIFEILTTEPMNLQMSADEIGEVVETAKKEIELRLADPRLWPPLKLRHIDLAQRFLAFEKELRTQFPEARVIGREAEIKGFINPETGELSKAAVPGALKFRGRIDRIDRDQYGNLAIYDYKSSDGSTSQFGSWIKNNRIQLLVYANAVENGLTEFEPQPVQSAMYYVVRPFTRDEGFKVEDVEQGLYATGGRKKNRLTTLQKEALFKEANAHIKKAIDGMRAGRFEPHPRDKKLCLTCQWSVLCRAPHLNS